ncbi:MAG: phage head-tail adapter protein [Clostridiales bacterium]|nr:phage head-tail adapter protein [Clostridiales bacterium]
MNREWSEKNKQMQSLFKKASFAEGIVELIDLRNILMAEMMSWRKELSSDDYSMIPYINADGYHSKTIAYSIWHIMRIEDIVVNTLILNQEEVLFADSYLKKINSPIITTGNELAKGEIAEFSKGLNLEALYMYAEAVKQNTDAWLKSILFDDLKIKFSEDDKDRIRENKVVSTAEEAVWLIDFWCGKDIKGLIRMPLSRHWIMHIEAANRIKSKLQ